MKIIFNNTEIKKKDNVILIKNQSELLDKELNHKKNKFIEHIKDTENFRRIIVKNTESQSFISKLKNTLKKSD